MRLFNKMILAAVFFAAFLDAASASGPVLNVWIKDQHGANVADVQVAAIDFGMNGPSTNTVAGLTGADGKVQFTLEAGKNYNIYYSSHGYSPSISDQFNSPVYDPNRNVYATGATEYFSTFTLTSGLTGVGRIQQQFTGASPSTLLFGGVYNMKSQMQGGTGLAPTDSSGNGILTVDNVPFAGANTYNINLYDPQKNNGIGRNVMTDLSVGTPTIAYVGAGPMLDFNKSVPAGRIENTAGGTAAAGASVEGVLKSTDGLTVPHMGIAIKTCLNGNQWNTWANSDDNGRFQLYGLTNGVTYYMQIMGGCTWSQADNISRCYEPFTTANYNAADICNPASLVAPSSNDIVYSSADVMYQSATINLMPPSIGEIKVCVKTSEGLNIPNANVNINPDGSPWPKNGNSCLANTYNDFYSSAGFSNANVNTGADGCATLGGLPSGNYIVNVWTPFSSGGNGPSSFNGNGDNFTAFGTDMNGVTNWMQAHCYGTGANDYRVTIDTNNVSQTMSVYNSSGAVVQVGGVDMSSITYIVTASSITSGEVKGTITFPAVTDLRANPIMITLYPNCSSGNCGSGNFTAIASSGSAHYNYSIHVASGTAYYMNISASGWGRVNKGGGDNTVHLEGSTSAVVNMEFAPAGTLTGTLYKPDGTIFTPANNQYIWVDAGSNNGWSNSQLQKDGTFALNDVLPGVIRMSVGSSGGDMSGVSFDYSLPMPAPTVNVIAGSTTTVSLNLVNAVNVGISTSTLFGKLPDTTVVADPGSSDMLLGFRVIPVKSGSVLDGTVIQNMLVSGSDGDLRFSYSLPTGSSGNGQCGNNWPGGFCGKAVPSPSVYDFYLMRSGDFGKGSGTTLAEMPYPHFVLLSSSKSVIIDAAHANSAVYMSNGMGVSSGVLVNVDPPSSLAARGNATAKGAVTALNFFRQADYDALGGNFDKFVSYLPLMALYDSGGKFSAAGIVVPSPKFIAEHDADFNSSFAKGYAEFKKVLDQAGGFGYEIRGLAPSTCYTAVMTTPNYPHYQTRLCTGVNKSTVTLNVNLDSAVGAGATVFGVVRSSATSAAIANASVELALEGSETRTAVTTSTGSFRFEGLSGGIAKITITAPNYAKVILEEALVGSNSYQENPYLFDAPGSMTGTVYSQKLPFAKVQAGAQVVAYDETYNHDNPASPLPLLTAITGADGTYLLDGLVPGDLYKVFLKVPGKYTLEVDTTATTGALAGVDFTMLPKPLDVEVFARDNKDTGRYEFTIMNPQDFKDGTVSYSVSPYSGPGTAVNFSKISSGELFGSIPRGNLVDNAVYVLHIDAMSLSNKTITKEILFGKNYNNSQQSIDALMLGDDSEDGTGRRNNEASVDKSGSDPSALVLPAGALITSSVAVIPSCSFTAESSNSVAVSTKVAAVPSGASVAGNLYTVSLSSVAQTDRSIELTLAYDKSLPDVSNLNVSQYNTVSGKWDTVPGLATVNPVKGTVTVKLKKLASVLSLRNAGPQAVFDGRKYVVRPQGAGGSTSTTGTFAVLNYAGDALPAGSKLKVFNYPNPFNLKTKAMSNNHNAATMPATTYGTMIHVEVPAGNGGACHIRIYTLAGELVKDISDTCKDNAYNYFAWDGRNKNGQEVANGVYYGVVTLSGKSPDRKDATFKMAVIK